MCRDRPARSMTLYVLKTFAVKPKLKLSSILDGEDIEEGVYEEKKVLTSSLLSTDNSASTS